MSASGGGKETLLKLEEELIEQDDEEKEEDGNDKSESPTHAGVLMWMSSATIAVALLAGLAVFVTVRWRAQQRSSYTRISQLGGGGGDKVRAFVQARGEAQALLGPDLDYYGEQVM